MPRLAFLTSSLALAALATPAAAVEPSLTGPTATYIAYWVHPETGVQYLSMTTGNASLTAEEIASGLHNVRMELVQLSPPQATTGTAVSGTSAAAALTAGSAIAVTGAATATIYYESQLLDEQQEMLDSYERPPYQGYVGGYGSETIDAVTSPTPWLDYYGDYFWDDYLAWTQSSNG